MRWFFIVLLWSSMSWAEEVDDFSSPPTSPADASDAINQAVKRRLTDVVKYIRDAKISCVSEREKIREALVETLDTNFSALGNALRARGGSVNSHSRFEESFRGVEVFGVRNKNESIYRGTSTTCCIGRINVGGTFIGIDKIDHFFGNAGILWGEYDGLKVGEPQRTSAIMARNVEQEHSGWGLGFTGVKSYGDLASNWKGFMFWKELVDGPRPYLVCKDGFFEVNPARTFRIQEYIDPAWDESINCSSYAREDIARTVRANIAGQDGRKCPRDQAACEKLRKDYADPLLRENLLSPLCRESGSTFSQVENKGSMSWSDWKKALRGINGGVIKDYFLGGQQ